MVLVDQSAEHRTRVDPGGQVDHPIMVVVRRRWVVSLVGSILVVISMEVGEDPAQVLLSGDE